MLVRGTKEGGDEEERRVEEGVTEKRGWRMVVGDEERLNGGKGMAYGGWMVTKIS